MDYALLAAVAILALGGVASAQTKPQFGLGLTTVASSPTQASTLAPILISSQPNVIQGQSLEANSVWVLGEVRNQGSTPAYNVTVTARLLRDSGTVAGTANQSFAFLGPGDALGYRIEVRNREAGARAEVSVDSLTCGFASFASLPIDWVKNEQVKDSQSHVRYEFTGILNNRGSQSVSLSAVHVWFLDDQDRVVWMDRTYVASSLAPGDSYTFSVKTPRDAENAEVSGITQVRYYAAGQLP